MLALAGGCDSQSPDPVDVTDQTPLQCEAQLPDTSGTCPTSPLSAEGAPESVLQLSDGSKIVQNLTYGSSGGLMLQGDLYLPAQIDANAGALITLHGGGWEDCGRRRSSASAVALVLSGALNVPVLNIDYRLRQEGGGYPNNLKDVMCATQFLSQQASTYGFEAGRVALMGESAGAHLALMGALIGDRDDLDPGCGETPEIVASVAVSPPTDFPAIVADRTPVAPAVIAYTGSQCLTATSCATEVSCDACIDASPVSHACAANDTNFLVVHAGNNSDPFINDSHINSFVNTMADGGSSIELVVATDTKLTDAGCPTGTAVHGFTECLTTVAGSKIIEILSAALK